MLATATSATSATSATTATATTATADQAGNMVDGTADNARHSRQEGLRGRLGRRWRRLREGPDLAAVIREHQAPLAEVGVHDLLREPAVEGFDAVYRAPVHLAVLVLDADDPRLVATLDHVMAADGGDLAGRALVPRVEGDAVNLTHLAKQHLLLACRQ